MTAYATYGPVCFALLLLGGWWTGRRRGDARAVAASVWAPVATLLAVGINQPIVSLVDEPRPYVTQHPLLVLATRSSDPSFPSDHAVMAGAATAGLFLVTRGLLAWITTLSALLLAFARVYIAAHYPHDVAVGLLGAAVTLLGWLLLRDVLTRLISWLQATRLRPLVTAADHDPATEHRVFPASGRR
jgi:membrane-associated phospholipid phosphatase